MKKAILMRHAKSGWGDPTLEDHDRPLNERGKAAAPAIARWLARCGHLPDAILCSSAKRARQTVKRMKTALPDLPEPKIENGLYLASPGAMRNRLIALPEECGAVLLIGHQPGIGALTQNLSDGRVRRECARAFEHFPTAAVAVLEFDIADWSGLYDNGARFVDFAVPRELTEKDGAAR